MIIATTDIDYGYIKSNVTEPDKVLKYVNGLIPAWAAHVRNIQDNQRYYVAIHVRNILTIPYKIRKTLTDRLIGGISLYGMINNFVTLDDILNECDKSKLIDALRWRIRDE